MWSGWAAELADRLALATGRPIHESLYGALGYDPATGRATAGGPLAAMPMARLRDLTLDVVRETGSDPSAAEVAVAAAWHAPDPLTLAHPLTDLRALFGGLRGRGIRVAVATSDDRAPTEATLAGLGVGSLVDGIVCADDGLVVKPEPDMLHRLCSILGVPAAATAMVGDSTADLAMGRAAGVARCIGVLSGVGSRDDLGPLADAIVGSVADLLPTR
jgi:phosphoglycolate phosphatase